MRYDAFISYRHSELDMFVAKQIHKRLETFSIPRSVAKKTGKKKIQRVFRDQEELPIGSDLGNNITNALSEAGYLIIICSPRTPESYWVQKEIETFIQMHGREHILAVLIEGEPDESFPKQILIDDNGNPVEPLAADVRGKDKKEVLMKLRTEILRLAAPVIGCSYDDLKQRHRERKIKRIAMFASLAAVLGIGFGAYSSYKTMLINQNYQEKLKNQSRYLADTALILYESGDRKTAAQVAMEALPVYEERPYVEEAQYALGLAVNSYDTNSVIKKDGLLPHDAYVNKCITKSDSDYLVSVDNASNVYIWDADKNELKAQIKARSKADNNLIYNVDVFMGETFVVICDCAGIRVFDYDGNPVWESEQIESVISAAYNADSDLIAVLTGDRIYLFNGKTGKCNQISNQTGINFSGQIVINQTGSRIAAMHYVDDIGNGKVSVFDADLNSTNKLIYEIETYGNDIMKIAFVDGTEQIAVLSKQEELNHYFTDADYAKMQCFEYKNGNVNWEYQIPCVLDNSSAIIKSRSYKDETDGSLKQEILLAFNENIYSWNSVTGKLNSQTGVGEYINDIFISVSSDLMYVALNSGKIKILDSVIGKDYIDNALYVDMPIRDIAFGKNGMLAAAGIEDKNLLLMKYHQGAGEEIINTFEASISNVYASAGEKTCAVATDDSTNGRYISFYDIEKNEIIAEWDISDLDYNLSGVFTDDEHFAVLNKSGELYIYNISKQETKQFSIMTEGKVFMQCNTENGQLLVYNEKEIVKVNGITGEIISKQELELPEEYRGVSEQAYAFSEDENKIAIYCVDSMIRVYDFEKQQTLCEIPFFGTQGSFMTFLKKDSELMVQGDDKYIKVYNISDGSLSYISKTENARINGFEISDEKKQLALYTSEGILLISSENYNRIAFAENGICCLFDKGIILSKERYDLIKFPYLNMDDLVKEAKTQFGDERLTELQRKQYNID